MSGLTKAEMLEPLPRWCTMRSKLEVRWSEHWDAAGVGWQYEPQWFDIASQGLCEPLHHHVRSKRYTPDFLLDDGTYVEIKPLACYQELNMFKAVGKVVRLWQVTGADCVLLSGEPGEHEELKAADVQTQGSGDLCRSLGLECHTCRRRGKRSWY